MNLIDSLEAYMGDCKDYKLLCKLMKVKMKHGDVDYDHFQELKSLPCIIWHNGRYIADKENYPEYFL